MGRWMFSVCIMVVEAWGNVYFFDTFLGRKKGIFFCRYRFPAYLAMMFAASTAGYWIDMWKLPVYILGYILLGRVCYQAGWIQGIYFSMLNYSMIFLTDLMLVSLMDLWETQEAIWGIWSVPGALFAKACWIVFIFLFRRVWKEGADYGELTDGEWLKLGLMPLFTLSSIVLTFFRCKEQPELRQICVFLSTGLVMVNFLVIWLLREILERGKKIRMGTESVRKTESQLAHYRDMQAVYERQGRKAVIHVKLVQEGGNLIFSVRNPVVEKVQVTEGTGLSNVKAVADKYGGDFAVSCDEEKFQAVVML